jgi:hypothetical protein
MPRSSVSRLTYWGFRPFPRPLHRFYSFRSFDWFDGLGQSTLPILSSEIQLLKERRCENIEDEVYIGYSGCSLISETLF